MREKQIELDSDDGIYEKNPAYDHIEGEINFPRMFDELEDKKLEILLHELERPHHEMPGEEEIIKRRLEKKFKVKLERERVATDSKNHPIICWRRQAA